MFASVRVLPLQMKAKSWSKIPLTCNLNKLKVSSLFTITMNYCVKLPLLSCRLGAVALSSLQSLGVCFHVVTAAHTEADWGRLGGL